MNIHSNTYMIDNLVQGLVPVKTLGNPVLHGAPWVIVSAAYIGICSLIIGVRADIADKMQDLSFLVENGLSFFVSVSAAVALMLLRVPDMRGKAWVSGVPFVFLTAFLLQTAGRAWEEGVYMPGLHWDVCFAKALVMAIVPAAGLGYLLRRGCTTHPYMSAVMTLMSFSTLSYIGLRFTCPVDTVGHSFVLHFFPFLVVGVVLCAMARRLYKW